MWPPWYWLQRGKPGFRLHHDGADRVELVVEGTATRFAMRRGRRGTWRCDDVDSTASALRGKAYHFEIQHEGETALLADPFAHVTGRTDERLVSRIADLDFRWSHARFRAPPMRDLVIYEAHLPALSRHPSSPVPNPAHRGTYLGATAPGVLDHLARLGVAVEFLPLHASDELLGADWGYFSTSFHAITERYATDPHAPHHELMTVVDAMHARGIPVLLDVVFNHGGELLARAWGEEIVYRRQPDGYFCHGSGCGPTIQTEHPRIRATIIDALMHLVHRYRIDGFRFDLGALHDVETMLEIDRRLPKRIYLIAEPWALGGTRWGKGDLNGALGETRWAVWNDDFREPGRKLITGGGDFHNRDRVMRALTGSHIADGGWARRPQQSINYLASHDGHTLADLVGGDPRRQFLGALLMLTSQGVPMLYEGTEMMFTKGGEHNTYNRPDLNQLDWSQAETHADLVEAVAGLVALRQHLPHFRYTTNLIRRHGDNANDADWDIDWIFPNGFPHDDNVNAIGYRLRAPRRWGTWRPGGQVIVLLNGSHQDADFTLPPGPWRTLADGSALRVAVAGLKAAPARDHYYVHPGTGAILAQRRGPAAALATLARRP